MGEPTCLMRSFSHPSSASREPKEGDPYRALTESISFGRFMSESLDWEKWSTFSHNRYLEEVEQFSKPGSVAQKKAFFEAHYKKRAALKAAAVLEQPSSIPEEEMVASFIPETKISVDSIPEEKMTDNNVPETEIHFDLLGDSLSVEATREIVIDQQEDQIFEPPRSYDADDLNNEKDGLQYPMTESAEEVIEAKEEAEDLIQVEHSKQLDNVENYGTTTAAPGDKITNEDAAEKENVALQKNTAPLPINKRQMSSLSKSSNQSRASKIPKSSTKMTSSTQINVGTNFKPKSKSSTGDLLNNKKVTSKSVHMSINLSCHSGLTSKSSVRMSKEYSTAPKNSSRASIHVTSKLLPSMNCQSDDKRYRTLVSKSVSGSTIAGGILQALSGDRTKSNGSKARSPIISSPFSFRSEERAAKRKEFFQKLEEKNVSKTHTQVKSKVPLTRPRSPKLGRKPSSNVVRETSSQLPQRPPVNPERIIPKSKQSTTRSVTSLPKKKALENASPNILH
ncbi:TPX2 (targeting protein for Xklp2) protein family [Euphorbia peplus]|nr:TPX2 (targeting protein for Xklp2) protein family [Euphorbia peplus]